MIDSGIKIKSTGKRGLAGLSGVGMPTRYVIDVEERPVSTTFSGILTLDDVVRHIASLRNDPKFDTDFSEIVDLSDALDVRLGYEDFKHLAELDPFSKVSKRAFVIPSSKVVLGVTRMYQVMQNDDPRIQIFRGSEEARQWVLQLHH